MIDELVRRLLERLGDLYMVDVVCHENVVPSYERLGLRRVDAAPGVRNPSAL